MINYYKILGIENYASDELVKPAYRSMIRTYHPDVNPSQEAKELSRWLNEAKETLLDPLKKASYDRQLQQAYLIEIQRLKSKDTVPDLLWKRKQRQRLKEEEKLRHKEQYEQGLRVFPYAYRVVVLLLCGLLGLWLYHTHYFFTLNGFDFLWSALGVFLFTCSALLMANQVYRHYWFRSMDRLVRSNYERWIARSLVVVLLLGSMGIYGINEYRKEYSMEFDFGVVKATVEVRPDQRHPYTYQYTVDGRVYRKPLRIDERNLHLLKKPSIWVKYAHSDPRISRVLE